MNHEDKLPKPRLRITPKALKKVETYAHLVAEELGSHYESIGFLLTEIGEVGPDIVVTDALLAHDQSVSGGSAQISPSGVLASGREIERKGKRCVGWWHAHPSHTFHSATDDRNLQTVLEDVSVSNCWSLIETKCVPLQWEDGALVIRTETETVRIIGRALAALAALRPCEEEGEAPTLSSSPPSEAGERGEVDLQAEVQSNAFTASAAYSLVVSAFGRSRPYAEMATQTRCAVCGRRDIHAQRVSIELVDPDPLDIEAMREEVRRKVSNSPRHTETGKNYSVAGSKKRQRRHWWKKWW